MKKAFEKIHLFPFLRVALFLIAGIVLGNELYGQVSMLVWAVLSSALTLLSLAAFRLPLCQSVLLLAACTAVGSFLTSYRLDRVNVPLPRYEKEYSAVVISQPVISSKAVRCDLLLANSPEPIKIKASFYREARSEMLEAGDGITGLFLLEAPKNYEGSSFDYKRYLIYHGYSATSFLYLDEWHYADVSLRGFSMIDRVRVFALKYRNKLLGMYRDAGFEGDAYAVLSAMTLGEKSALTKEIKDDYSVSGASHILALSGLHLGIIYSILTLFLGGRRRVLIKQVLVILAIWTYVFIVGMPVSAIRSAVMLTVYSFAVLLNRNRMSLNALSFAAVVMLLSNPSDLYDVGFQMSFMAVLFIIIFYRPFYYVLPARWRGIFPVRWCWQMASVSMAAQIGVAPLIVFYFGRFSCYFLLTNFLVIPVSTLIIYSALPVMLLGAYPGIQVYASAFLLKVVSFLNDSVSFLASLPGASIDGINMNLLQLFLYYVSVFCLYVIIIYMKKIRRIGRMAEYGSPDD